MGDRGTRRFVVVERKLFDLVLEGETENILRITKNGRRRRLSIYLSVNEASWLEETWREVWKQGIRVGWFRRRRDSDKTLLFQIQKNKWGRMIVITEINAGGSRAIIIPEGVEQAGWRGVFNGFAELMALSRSVTVPTKKLQRRDNNVTSWVQVAARKERVKRIEQESKNFSCLLQWEACCSRYGLVWKDRTEVKGGLRGAMTRTGFIEEDVEKKEWRREEGDVEVEGD